MGKMDIKQDTRVLVAKAEIVQKMSKAQTMKELNHIFMDIKREISSKYDETILFMIEEELSQSFQDFKHELIQRKNTDQKVDLGIKYISNTKDQTLLRPKELTIMVDIEQILSEETIKIKNFKLPEEIEIKLHRGMGKGTIITRVISDMVFFITLKVNINQDYFVIKPNGDIVIKVKDKNIKVIDDDKYIIIKEPIMNLKYDKEIISKTKKGYEIKEGGLIDYSDNIKHNLTIELIK